MTIYEVDCYSPTSAALFTLTVAAQSPEAASKMALEHLDMVSLVSGEVRVVAEPGEAKLLVVADGKVTALLEGTEPCVVAHCSGTRKQWA